MGINPLVNGSGEIKKRTQVTVYASFNREASPEPPNWAFDSSDHLLTQRLLFKG